MNDRMLTARTFVTLAQTLSFTQTADALDLSVPRVSRLIQSLEAELGCRLVHRTTRATTLTSEGEAFLPRVRDWLDEGDNLFAEGPVLKQLRAAASVPFFEMGLTEILADFSKANPQIRLDFTVTAEPLDLVKNAIDIGFQEGIDPQPGYVARPLGTIACRFCASPAYLAEAGVPETLEALAEHRLLSLKNASDRWCFTGPDGSACELAVRPFFSGEFCERARAVCVGQCRYCARA